MPENENQVQEPETLEPVILAGNALEPSITITNTANGVISRPEDNDGNYENYVDATPYDGYAKRISHDTDNIAFRIYDHDYNVESETYSVYINEESVTETTMVVGDAKKFEVRCTGPSSSVSGITPPSLVVGDNEVQVPVSEPEPTVTADPSYWVNDLPGLIWVSEDPTIVTIIEGNKVWARKPGVVYVRVYNSNETEFKASLKITVVEATEENVFTIEV